MIPFTSHSGTVGGPRTHQTLLFTRSLAANEADWVPLCPQFTHVPLLSCQQQLSAQNTPSSFIVIYSSPTSDPGGCDISRQICDHFYWRTLLPCSCAFKLASYFAAKNPSRLQKHLPNDKKSRRGLHKGSSYHAAAPIVIPVITRI
ncbi:hypothetical protein XELAEV_18046212mg [Xenopus laevis]|uniref:Uncharacterized protein n=1 Tax=Xenopus laevis TaxID=8355 RepID=A0A974BSH7_XENLA|nr:hypothetical protein XELAEV_18046212mg [Xenopus laevis]